MSRRMSAELVDVVHREFENDPILPEARVFNRSMEERNKAVRIMKHVCETENRETFCNFLQEKLNSGKKSQASTSGHKRKKKKSHQKLETKGVEKPVDSDDDDINISKIKNMSYETLFNGDEEFISKVKEIEKKVEEREREAVKYGKYGKTIILKIKYREQIFKTWIKMNVDFSEVFYYIAKKFKADIRCIMILLSKKIIAIEDTPMKLGIKESDIIDCLIFYSWVMNPTNKQNCLNIQVHAEDGQIATFQIHKLEKFHYIMEKYCAEKNVPLQECCFKFNERQIFPVQTPYQLKLKSGSIIYFQMP